VPAAAHGNFNPQTTGEAYGRQNVRDLGHLEDRCGTTVDHPVVHMARGLVLGVALFDNLPADLFAEHVETIATHHNSIFCVGDQGQPAPSEAQRAPA
jgi:hypothetical protein